MINPENCLILFTVPHDQPGALCNALAVIKEFGINITKIDSMPSRQAPWHYLFFIQLDGNPAVDPVKSALIQLSSICNYLKLLGTFPNVCKKSI